MKYFEKQAAYYHGHSLKKIKKILKVGISAGEYLAKKRWISDLYASQYPIGRTLRINIPRNMRSEYLTEDPANTVAKAIFGKLNSSMKSNKVVKKHIPTKFISTGPMNPNLERPSIKKFRKEIDNSLNKIGGVTEEYKASPKGLLYIAPTGSGKTKKILDSIRGEKAVAITPASLTKNLDKEEKKFFNKVTPRKSYTYAAMARGADLPEAKHLVLDESHNIRNPKTKSFQNIASQRWKYDKAFLATATPMYNEPYDIVSQVNLVANKKILPMNKKEFYGKYYREIENKPGFIGRLMGIKGSKEKILKDPSGVRALLDQHTYVVGKGHTKGLMPGKHEEEVRVPMTKNQADLYKTISKEIPFALRYKINKNLPPSKAEAKTLNSYLMGVRQISNTTKEFSNHAESPKFERMVSDAKGEVDSGGKVLMYSNFRGSGVDALSERLNRLRISHGKIVGSMTKKQRSEEVDKYNSNKNKVLIYSGAGAEGLNLPKTTLVQVAEPYWNTSRTNQAAARGIRRGDDPSRNVKVKKYISVLPQEKNFLGFNKRKKSSVDEYLTSMGTRKSSETEQFLEALRDE